MDIPPALYISQNYLEALGYKVLGYNDVVNLKNLKDVDATKYQVVCLPSWKIDLLYNNKFDLFVNYHSFQYLEPELVENYIKKISPQITKYIYLNNFREGTTTEKEEKLGVLRQTTTDHYLTFLKNNFKIKTERDSEDWYGTRSDYFEMLLTKN